jgi:hypothetical protein
LFEKKKPRIFFFGNIPASNRPAMINVEKKWMYIWEMELLYVKKITDDILQKERGKISKSMMKILKL